MQAAAWCGMSEEEFLATTPRYLDAAIKAKINESREVWSIARQTAYWSILPHVGKKKIKPTDLAFFAWEKPKGILNPYGTKEALKLELEKFKEICNRLEFK